MTTRNGTGIGYFNLVDLLDCPFAEELFEELAQKSPDVLKALWKDFGHQLQYKNWVERVAKLAGVEIGRGRVLW